MLRWKELPTSPPTPSRTAQEPRNAGLLKGLTSDASGTQTPGTHSATKIWCVSPAT